MLVPKYSLLAYHIPTVSRSPATPMKTMVANMPVVTARGCTAREAWCRCYIHAALTVSEVDRLLF